METPEQAEIRRGDIAEKMVTLWSMETPEQAEIRLRKRLLLDTLLQLTIMKAQMMMIKKKILRRRVVLHTNNIHICQEIK
jgi:hypothetical protein